MSADLIERLRETVANCRNPKPKQLAPEFWPALADEIEEAANALATQEKENVAVGEFIDLMTDQIEANSKAHEAILATKDTALSEMRAELERLKLSADERMLLAWMLAAFEDSKVGQKITDDLKREMRAANRLVARLSAARAASQDEGDAS